MRVLIVKLSSLGDVVHAMPAVQDIRTALPQARIDWVVERGFAPLVRRCEGVGEVIECELRRWRKAPLAAATRAQWRAFRETLRRREYDAVIDLQGLTKSALVARMARLAAGGKRYALANRTEGSSYEAPTRWLADVAVYIEPHIHAVTRSRELCGRALGYSVPCGLRFGLRAQAPVAPGAGTQRMACFVHGTSRADKCWPEANWIELGRRLLARGWCVALPHGNDEELARSERLARALGSGAQVWPRLDLGTLTDRVAGCDGVLGVDSGLSHIAVALGVPHVQIYNFDTAWRTGPVVDRDEEATAAVKALAVFAQPWPEVDAVWQAWQRVSPP